MGGWFGGSREGAGGAVGCVSLARARDSNELKCIQVVIVRSTDVLFC